VSWKWVKDVFREAKSQTVCDLNQVAADLRTWGGQDIPQIEDYVLQNTARAFALENSRLVINSSGITLCNGSQDVIAIKSSELTVVGGPIGGSHVEPDVALAPKPSRPGERRYRL